MGDNHQMEVFLSNASGSSEDIGNEHDDLDYGLLPSFSTSSLRSEIPERLLQDDASTLSPSYNEQNMLATHNLLQENTYSPQEPPFQQNDPIQQEEVHLPWHEDAQDQPEDVSESSTALFQEQNHAETDQDVRKPSRKPYSWKEKLGTLAIVGLIAGSVLLCASVGTLAFMWFGSPEIPAWKEITARNWLSKAISICIGIIQQVMMLQLGIVTATLASLALESREVVISDVASVSAMRATATSTGAFIMAWQHLSRRSLRSARHSKSFFLIISAALLWCLSQFLMLILLTDVSLRSTAGLVSTVHLPYNLYYNECTTDGNCLGSTQFVVYPSTQFIYPSAGAWNRKVSEYASFAEYSEPPYEADGVIDTGLTMRAFLPFSTAQNRESLESYKGKATVLDARVTCQVPQIQNATVDYNRHFRGSLAATRKTPRLANAALDDGSNARSFEDTVVYSDRPKDFDCVVNFSRDSESLNPQADQWAISLCQLWQTGATEDTTRFGGLVSEFGDPTQVDEYFNSTAYLYLNTTLGESEDFKEHVQRQMVINGTGLVVAEASHERGEWLDLTFLNSSIVISASICYAAFDLADIDVRISSRSNRTESRLEPIFDPNTSTYTFKALRHAMGQDRSLPLGKRGILQLEKRDWQAENHTNPSSLVPSFFPRLTANMFFTTAQYMDQTDIFDSNTTGILSSGGSCFKTGNAHCTDNCFNHIPNCVVLENMHVSTSVGYRPLPYPLAVLFVTLIARQSTKYCIASMGRHVLSLFTRRKTHPTVYALVADSYIVDITRTRDPQDKRFHRLRSPNHDHPAQ